MIKRRKNLSLRLEVDVYNILRLDGYKMITRVKNHSPRISFSNVEIHISRFRDYFSMSGFLFLKFFNLKKLKKGFGEESFDGEVCGEKLQNCNFAADGQQVTCETPNIGSAQNCEFLFYDRNGQPHAVGARSGFSFNFDPNLTPFVNSISPKMGGSMGGTRITIQGTGFVPGSQSVTIGKSLCLILSESTNQIICETEPHPTSTKHRFNNHAGELSL